LIGLFSGEDRGVSSIERNGYRRHARVPILAAARKQESNTRLCGGRAQITRNQQWRPTPRRRREHAPGNRLALRAVDTSSVSSVRFLCQICVGSCLLPFARSAQHDGWRSIDGRASMCCPSAAPETPMQAVRERAIDDWVSALRCVDPVPTYSPTQPLPLDVHS
jgi:hypothetical protein